MAAPRIAVVLGAGGTVGHAYHAGVLATLAEELGWDARHADLLVGTSAGSVVAALLRAGLPAADLARRASEQPLSPEGAALIAQSGLGPPRRRQPRRPALGSMASPARLARAVRAPWEVRPGSLAAAMLPEGRIPTEPLAAPLDALYGETWPDEAMWIVAVDLDTGRRVVFGRPEAPAATPSAAVRASCAIPAYFEPVEIDGARYVDGGVHSTTNADLVAPERPDLVLISAPMSAVRGVARIGAGMAIRNIARLSLAREVAALRSRGIPAVVFQPTAADLEVMAGDSLDPAKFAPVCARAIETTTRRLSRPDVRATLGPLADDA